MYIMNDKYLNHVLTYMNLCYTKTTDSMLKDEMIIKLPYGFFSPNTDFFRNEMYYWDSYFTLKLLYLWKVDIYKIKETLNNFSFLIKKFGFIPNASRYDFLSRSQMPLFGLCLFETENCNDSYLMDCFNEEIKWWNQYPHPKYGNFKKISNNSYFRYFADFNESTAVCESGWDYSRRWFINDKKGCPKEKITSLFPVDLNSVMLFNLKLLGESGYKTEPQFAELFKSFDSFFWNKELNFYVDYNFELKKQSTHKTLAGFMPMYFNFADKNKANRMVEQLDDFLYPHGLSTMLKRTKEEDLNLKYEKKMQWEYPNGWAPLNYFVAIALLNYDYIEMAEKIMRCFCKGCENYFDKHSTFPEKILVDPESELASSDYINQTGFGWTNAVYGIFRLYLRNKITIEDLKTKKLF